jgi:hypothetical protein
VQDHTVLDVAPWLYNDGAHLAFRAGLIRSDNRNRADEHVLSDTDMPDDLGR